MVRMAHTLDIVCQVNKKDLRFEKNLPDHKGEWLGDTKGNDERNFRTGNYNADIGHARTK